MYATESFQCMKKYFTLNISPPHDTVCKEKKFTTLVFEIIILIGRIEHKTHYNSCAIKVYRQISKNCNIQALTIKIL